MKRKKSTRALMGIRELRESSFVTEQGEEVVFFLIQPTNLSVLSRDAIMQKEAKLAEVLKSIRDCELLAMDSSECFDDNKRWLQERSDKEDVPQLRNLLAADAAYLSEIQTRTVTSREFMLCVWVYEKTDRLLYTRLSQMERSIRAQGFTVRRAGREEIKQMLAVYYAQDMAQTQTEEYDGERWIDQIEKE